LQRGEQGRFAIVDVGCGRRQPGLVTFKVGSYRSKRRFLGGAG
jgi:hypothetical protein